MKAKELKDLLTYINDDEELFIDVGGRRTELASFRYDGQVCFTSHNYMMDDQLLTVKNMAHYITELANKNKDK